MDQQHEPLYEHLVHVDASLFDALPLALTLVESRLLCADPDVAPLRHVAALFTQLLDAAPLVSLPKAAASGSLQLFNRAAERYAIDAGLDRGQRDFWFARAMQAALENDDVAMLQRIHALHPEALDLHVLPADEETSTNALGLAFKHCTLETIQWLIEHRADRACCAPGIANVCHACLIASLRSIGDRDMFRIVMWLMKSWSMGEIYVRLMAANMVETSPEILRWVGKLWCIGQAVLDTLLLVAIQQRRTANAIALLDIMQGLMAAASAKRCLLFASFGGLDEVVELMIARGHCRPFQDRFVLAPMAPGGPSFVQWAASSMHEFVPHDCPTAAHLCIEAAARCGNLSALQWLYHERGLQPNGSLLVRRVDDETTVLESCKWMLAAGILDRAAASTSWNVAGETDYQLPPIMAGEDIDRYSRLDDSVGMPAMMVIHAAHKGFLTVVQWIHHEYSSIGSMAVAAMANAAARGHLALVQWLQEYCPVRFTTQAVVFAADHGHLEVAQWLHEHRREDVNVKQAIDHAATNGHLDVVLWLTGTQPGTACTRCIMTSVLEGTGWSLSRCTSVDVLQWNDAQPVVLCAACRTHCVRLYDVAASLVGGGDLELLKYLHDNHRERVQLTNILEAARRAMRAGHLGILLWLYVTFGGFRVYALDDWTDVVAEAKAVDHSHIRAWARSLTE